MTNVVNLTTKVDQREALEKFATIYANNGGDHIKAYVSAGFSEKTAGQNAKKYLDKHHDYVMSIVKKQMGQDASLVSMLLRKCVTDETIPWNNRLKAMEMMLKNSGVQKDTLVIEENNVDELTPEQRQAELKELMEKYRAHG